MPPSAGGGPYIPTLGTGEGRHMIISPLLFGLIYMEESIISYYFPFRYHLLLLLDIFVFITFSVLIIFHKTIFQCNLKRPKSSREACWEPGCQQGWADISIIPHCPGNITVCVGCQGVCRPYPSLDSP